MEHDILSFYNQSRTSIFDGNSFTSLKNSEIKRYGVRRFEGGMQFQSSRIGSADAPTLLAESRNWGGPGTPHTQGFAPERKEQRHAPNIDSRANQEFEEAALEFISKHPNFVFSGKCVVNKEEIELRSSYGLDLSAKGSSCDWYLAFQRKGSGNMFDGFFGENIVEPNFAEELAKQEEYLLVQHKEAKLTSGHMPVVFTNSEGVIAKLIESFSSQRYEQGSCFYAGKLGEQLFSPSVTLLDQAYDPERGSHQFFDGDGIVRNEDSLVLVDKGRFASLIYDLRFGKKYGKRTTGNGIRSFNSGVNLGLRSLRFKKGEHPWRETIKGFDRCVLALVAAGGDSNELGEYSSPVQMGYVFERGELVGRAPQITVKTSVDAYLGRNLLSVASDGFPSSAASPCVISEMEVIVN